MNLIKLGSGVITVQNYSIIVLDIFVVFSFFNDSLGGTTQLLFALLTVFVLDLIGFMIFAIGLINLSIDGQEDNRRHKIAGIGIIGWFLIRFMLQYGLIIGILIPMDISTSKEVFTITLFWYGINSLCLLISGLTMVNKRYLYYTILNFFAVWITILGWIIQQLALFLEITIFIKLVTVPVLAIFVFRGIYDGNWEAPKSEKYTTEIYPKYQYNKSSSL